MPPNRDSCEVYVESIAERRTVPFSALTPFSKPLHSQNRSARSGARKYLRYHGEIIHEYYGGGFRGYSRPLRCILPSTSSLLSQHESCGYKSTVKRKYRNYSKDEKSYNDVFRCNINFELSSSKTMKASNVPYDLQDLTALSNFKPLPSQVTAVPLLVQNNSNPPVRHHNNTNRLVSNHNKNSNCKHTQQKNNMSGESGGDSKPTTDSKTQTASQKVDTDYKPEPESRKYFSGPEFAPNTFDGGIQQNLNHPGMDLMHAGQRFDRSRHYYGSQNSHHTNESSGNIHFVFVRKLTSFILSSFNFNRMAPVNAGQQLHQLFDSTT